MSNSGLTKPTPPEHHKRTQPKALFVIVMLCAVGFLGALAHQSPTIQARTTDRATEFVNAFSREPATATGLVCRDATLPRNDEALRAEINKQFGTTQLSDFRRTSYESPDSTGVAFVYGTTDVAGQPTSVVFGIQHVGHESCVFSLHSVAPTNSD